MMKEKIGVLVCIALLLSMTCTAVSAQIIQTEGDKGINYMENSPPSDPVITALDTVRKNRAFTIKFTSTDPDEDQIYYRYKLGDDGTATPWGISFPSGYTLKVRVRIMGFTGDLTVGCQAKDIHDAESGWTFHTITFTNVKSRTYNLAYLLSLFPRLSRLLNL